MRFNVYHAEDKNMIDVYKKAYQYGWIDGFNGEEKLNFSEFKLDFKTCMLSILSQAYINYEKGYHAGRERYVNFPDYSKRKDLIEDIYNFFVAKK